MKIIEPSFEILTPFSREDALRMLQHIERCARICYKSEGRTTADSASEFVRKISGTFKHESVIEHCSVSVLFIVDRGVTHEIVRHRLAAYSQESTRYCNYGRDVFGKEITVIRPPFWSPCDDRFALWENSCLAAESAYIQLLEFGASPQEARSVLPNSLKTEIAMTATCANGGMFSESAPPARLTRRCNKSCVRC